jgi:hypothetical protein
MSLEKISEQLASTSGNSARKMPPVELWNPPFCGDIDLQIKADGTWFYGGSAFKRMSLVKMFASVLICDESKSKAPQYFLITPVEKVGITVEDAPFLITQWRWCTSEQSTMMVTTNLDDEFELSAEHPMQVTDDGSLYVNVRRNLLAKVHRNVYYQWVDLAQEVTTENGTELVFYSAEQMFSLGKLES